MALSGVPLLAPSNIESSVTLTIPAAIGAVRSRVRSRSCQRRGMTSGYGSQMPLRCVYTDLDGTLLGRYGSLFRDAEGDFSMLQARALEACHRADVEVVIKSGRREGSVLEDAKLIGSRSYICEVGCLVVIDGERTVLAGDAEADPGKTLAETMVDRGIPDELFEHFAGRLEWHSPWHRQRELSLLFRGKIDVEEANRLLARARPHRGLRLLDNGAIFAPMEGIEGPAHAYHLLPEAASKANAVAFHMRARGYAPEECIAIGDSVEDLAVAEVVGRFFVPANGPERDPALARGDRRAPERHRHRGADGGGRLRGDRLYAGGRSMKHHPRHPDDPRSPGADLRPARRPRELQAIPRHQRLGAASGRATRPPTGSARCGGSR